MSKNNNRSRADAGGMGESGRYANVVAKVKATFAELDRPYAGDEVTHEIAKRWAKEQGRTFDEPAPETADAVPVTTTAPTAIGMPEEVKDPAAGKFALPDDPEG